MGTLGGSNSSRPDHPVFRVGDHVPSLVYFYTDGTRTPVGAVARFEAGTLNPDKKEFRQYRYENGGYIPGLDGQQLPLYRLAELLSLVRDPQVRVYVAEGEKCVEALIQLGVPATTNPGGADKWRDEHSESLRGHHVVVVIDNDPSGRRHGQKVAASLHGKAASVRVMESPGAAGRPPDDGYDVFDWRDAGGTVQELEDLADATRVWSPPSTSSDWAKPIPFACNSDAEPFPIDTALTPTLSDLAAAIAESVKIDPTAPGVFIPAVISCAAGNAFSVRVSRSYVEPNVARFVVWNKDSGERGSETFRRLDAPLNAWVLDRTDEYLVAKRQAEADAIFYRKLAEQAETRAAKERDGSKQEEFRQQAIEARRRIPAIPPAPLLHIGDSTSEATVRSMAAQGGAIGMFSGDARDCAEEILGRYRKDGRTSDAVYLKGHGGDLIDRNRVGLVSTGEYLVIPHPSLTMALCIQSDRFGELVGRPELIVSGFIPRCNLFKPKSLRGYRLETGLEEEVDADILDGWDKTIRSIVDERFRILREHPNRAWPHVELVLDREAMDLRRQFANEIELRQRVDQDLHRVPAFASKAAGEAARLAGLLHLANLALSGRLGDADSIAIPAATWRIAEAHQRWQMGETLRVLEVTQESAQTRQARRVLAWCERKPGERRVITASDLVSARIVDGADEGGALLAWLAERAWARPAAKARASKVARFEIHPSVFGEVASGHASPDSTGQYGGGR